MRFKSIFDCDQFYSFVASLCILILIWFEFFTCVAIRDFVWAVSVSLRCVCSLDEHKATSWKTWLQLIRLSTRSIDVRTSIYSHILTSLFSQVGCITIWCSPFCRYTFSVGTWVVSPTQPTPPTEWPRPTTTITTTRHRNQRVKSNPPSALKAQWVWPSPAQSSPNASAYTHSFNSTWQPLGLAAATALGLL